MAREFIILGQRETGNGLVLLKRRKMHLTKLNKRRPKELITVRNAVLRFGGQEGSRGLIRTLKIYFRRD
jgi:hypothetical protein